MTQKQIQKLHKKVHHMNGVVKFRGDNRNETMYLPADTFRVSPFLLELLENAVNGEGYLIFSANMSDAHASWIRNKAREYMTSEDTSTLEGRFWDNVNSVLDKEEVGLMAIDYHNKSQSINLDEGRERKAFYNELLVEAGIQQKKPKTWDGDNYEDEKEDDEVREEDDIRDILEGLGNYGDPLKNTKSNRKAVAKKAKKDKKTEKGNIMNIDNIKDTIVTEVKELANTSGAADIALGRILYNNLKSALGKTVVKISFLDRLVAKVSTRMKLKNEVTELMSVLALMVVAKQFYDHKALENVRGYIVNRLYTIGIEATGLDDVLALIKQTDDKTPVNS